MRGGEDLYIIQMAVTGDVKVGRSSDVDRRIRELQTGCPHRLRLILHLPGEGGAERSIHDSFRRYRTKKGFPSFPDTIPPDRYQEMLKNLIPIEGSAGDMIIWDDDGLHANGMVHAGRTRKVVRAVSGIPWEAQPTRYRDPNLPPSQEVYTAKGLWIYFKGVVKTMLGR